MPLDADVQKEIEDLLKRKGIKPDHTTLQSMALTNVPSDSFLTKVYIMRAEMLAENEDYSHHCWGCGKGHNSKEDFIDCFGTHIVEFMAGKAPQLTEEEIEKRVAKLHPKHQDQAREYLRNPRGF